MIVFLLLIIICYLLLLIIAIDDYLLYLMIIYCNKTNFSSSVNMRLLGQFFNDKILQVQKSTKKHIYHRNFFRK